MRYVRFLKTPRIVEKHPAKPYIYCLVTVTSDLGDSFLPHDVVLSAELRSAESNEEVIVWSTAKWTGGMRSLPITLPFSKSRAATALRVRVGVGEPNTLYDTYHGLYGDGQRGVVSAWSEPLSLQNGIKEAAKLVERRFQYDNGQIVKIREETGESIARHLWDAGLTMSCHLENRLVAGEQKPSPLAQALPNRRTKSRFQVLELGTGCGMVGISVAQMVEEADVVLTDLAEAEEIAQRNIANAKLATGTTLKFHELDWDEEIPKDLNAWSKCPHCAQFDFICAADCTYNPDSSPALVNTLRRLTKASPDALVAIAMKKRHSTEEVFFDLMSEAQFKICADELVFPLPGDEETGEETVFIYLFRYEGDVADASPNEFCCAAR